MGRHSVVSFLDFLLTTAAAAERTLAEGHLMKMSHAIRSERRSVGSK